MAPGVCMRRDATSGCTVPAQPLSSPITTAIKPDQGTVTSVVQWVPEPPWPRVGGRSWSSLANVLLSGGGAAHTFLLPQQRQAQRPHSHQ